MYPALKHLHMAAAGVSIALFLIRGAWMFADSPRLQSGFARIVPHVVDTVLLASAIGLMFRSSMAGSPPSCSDCWPTSCSERLP